MYECTLDSILVWLTSLTMDRCRCFSGHQRRGGQCTSFGQKVMLMTTHLTIKHAFVKTERKRSPYNYPKTNSLAKGNNTRKKEFQICKFSQLTFGSQFKHPQSIKVYSCVRQCWSSQYMKIQSTSMHFSVCSKQ